MATIQELLLLGKEKLDKSGNEYSKYESKILLEEVLDCNYMYMLMHGEKEVSKEREEQYMGYIDRRCEHYPLQYLLGQAYFMDYTFYVNEHVLIPRNDTEILVETVLDLITPTASVLDLCCGSGCIGISLKLYHKELELILADISEKALEVAKRNLKRHNVEAKLIYGNLFEGISKRVDMIVSNPPYIESPIIDTLMPEVKEHEPMLALDGGEDGLDFYRKITAQAQNYLNADGWLLFEIGSNQGKIVTRLMKEMGFSDINVKKDYAGLDRVVYGHL